MLQGKNIGIALTGSFCTYKVTFQQIEKLASQGANVTVIFSNASQTINSRFGEAENFMKQAKEITKNPIIRTIEEAEKIGPKSLFDLLVICPCTGNTVAKLANAITDTPVLMAAKAHLRNQKPVLLSIASNDALGLNMKNIGVLLNSKYIYFVPFGQDNPAKKPNSLVADVNMLVPALESALEGKQYQPVICGSPIGL